ncbi:4Fe-4S dicluster domain-containing protein, partial [Salidesulfovibrio brasiliensis]|uniref:4Fe-4S dicluster domain-containing protein n=1 Tax=Salidesulfovibrio brasiliensis TaxID=221711 RepID=UPI0006D03C9A
DILLLARSTSGGPWRWTAAMLTHAGFIGLLAVHAFGPQTADLFGGYFEATLDPYFFLRDLFGLMLILGVLLALVRRLGIRRIRQTSGPADWLLLVIVGGIAVSGVAWQAAKSMSPAAFERMTEEYFYGDEEQLAALRAVWTVDYDVVFKTAPDTAPEMLALGREMDEESCRGCHAPASSAFLSHLAARALKPAARSLESARVDILLGHAHALFLLAGLLLLPLGKFAHVLTTPLNLLIRRGSRSTVADTGRKATGRSLGLTACTHCGECAARCSVGAAYDVLGIRPVLPSEKLADLNAWSAGRLKGGRLADFTAGSRICSECMRCTEVCPSGIDLQELWLTSKRRMVAEGAAGLQHEMPGKSPAERMETLHGLPESEPEKKRPVRLTARREAYLGCVQCTTCTSVCPVVAASSNPARDLDFTPQQVMNLLRMGLVDHALGAGMTWNCVTCYKCQEHCPQGVPVADVLFELRNIANARVRARSGGGKR